MKVRLIAIFIAIACLCSCAREPRLVILHVNDTHSHFEPVRSGEEAGFGGSVERAAIVDSVRALYGEDRVLLLHAGDFSQGSSYFSELNGALEPQVMNAFKYDCTTIGNHELDNDIEALTERVAMLENTKVVCANIDLSPFEISKYIKPYTIIEKGGMKIGIIGMISNISTNVSAVVSSRIPKFDNVEVVNRWSAELAAQDCDLVILLSHLGFREDLEIIPQVSGIDLVIGGHSHTFVDDFEYAEDLDGKKVPVIQAGCWGLEMGEIKVW